MDATQISSELTRVLYTNDQILKAGPWNDMVLAWRNGAPIRVRDVGVAVDVGDT